MTEGDRLCPYCTKAMEAFEPEQWTEYHSYLCIPCQIEVTIRERHPNLEKPDHD